MRHMSRLVGGILAAFLLGVRPSAAETGASAWLRYERIGDPAVRARYDAIAGPIATLGQSPILSTARDELVRGLASMLDRTFVAPSFSSAPTGSASRIGDARIILGTVEAIRRASPRGAIPELRSPGAFWVGVAAGRIVIVGKDERGALYGTFALLRRVAMHEPIDGLNDHQEPAAAMRWTNEWDNLDGSIERGYAGPSIFFERDSVAGDLTRARDYARLLASIGINGCAVNNVNANPRAITHDFIVQLARIADAFRPWGVSLAASIDFSSPMKIGGLETFDPLDPRVAAFWKDRVDDIYKMIPDFGGFVLKADSEGRLGPSAYGRTHADAANVVARAVAPHGGVVFYRGFVYDHLMDWHDLKNDRARAAVDNFKSLDGRFDSNVILQIKNGPIDFQVREPASPLFAAVPATTKAIEVQITQEYLGQQRHVVFLPPMWKETLDFDMQLQGKETPVTSLVSAYVGVSNVGLTTNWLGHDLAMANLYGFGRLAWQPGLSPSQIGSEWTTQTFGHERRVDDAVGDILLQSWKTY